MSKKQKRDYYEILGIDKNATSDEIKRAFRRLAKEYHPDVSSVPNAEEKFKEINEAYQILSNEQKRANYDRFGHESMGFESSNFADFNDIFSGFADLFNQNPYGRHQRSEEKIDKIFVLNLTFFEAMHGVTKTQQIEFDVFCSKCKGKGGETNNDVVKCQNCNGRGHEVMQIFGLFSQKVTCSKCKGNGIFVKNKCSFCRGKKIEKRKENLEINVPKGVQSGQQMRFENKAKINTITKKSGDLFVEFYVEPNPIFKREENDLFTDVYVSYLEVLLGKEISVPTIDGIKKIDIDVGIKNNKIVRLKNYGSYDPNNSKRRGHQYLRIKIELPNKLSAKEIELINEIDKNTKFNPNQDFIEKIKKKG